MDKELRQFSLSSRTVNEQKTSKLTWCSGTHKYSVILLTSTSLGCSRRKVLEVYLISSTKETKQAHQIQSIMLQASWHSKFLHICFKSFKFLLLKTKCSLSHPERTVKHQMWGTYVKLKTTCLSHFPSPFYSLGVRRKSSEQYSCHIGTTAVTFVFIFFPLIGYTNLVWSHAKCYSITIASKWLT